MERLTLQRFGFGSLIIGLGLQCAGVTAQTPPAPQEADLPNGLHLIVLEDHRVPTVSFQMLIIGAGGYHDPPEAPAVARFTAAMLRQGTTSRTARQIAEELGRLKATLDVSTGMANQAVTLSGAGLAEDTDAMLDLLADLLLHPSFPDDALAGLKTRTRGDLVRQRTDPAFLAADMLARRLYGAHPGARVAPTHADVDRVTRPAVMAFYRDHYIPDFAVMGMAGDITLADATRKLTARLGAWSRMGAPRPGTTNPDASARGGVLIVDVPSGGQTAIVVGAPVMNRIAPDYDALQVLTYIIGGTNGRLGVALQGFTPSVTSGVTALNYTGNWRTTVLAEPEVVDTVITELDRALARIRTERVPAEELTAAKRSMVAQFRATAGSPTALLANHLTRWAYREPAAYVDQYADRVMAVSADDVLAIGQKYLTPARLQYVAVGDAHRLAAPLRKLGPVEIVDSTGKRIDGR